MPEKIKITDTAVAGLAAPKKGQVIYRDTELPGFGVRLLPSGRRAFVAEKWHKGRVLRDTIGTYPATSSQEARKRARKMLGRMEEGINPNAVERLQKAADVTLDDVFNAYMVASRTRLAERTKSDYTYIIERHLADYRERPLIALTPEAVQALHQSIGEISKSWGNYTARVIRLLVNYAGERYKNDKGESLFPVNPVRVLKRRWHKVFRRKTVIPSHLWAAWLKAVLRLDDDAARVWLLLQTLCGFRPGEAQRVLRRDVDLVARTLTIRGTKNKSDFVFPLPPYLRGVLREYLEGLDAEETYLFPSRGKKRPYRAEWRPAMAEVAGKVGMHFIPTDLRRGFVSTAESMDLSKYTLKALLNHVIDETNDVTAGYLVISPERLRGAVQSIEDILLRQGKVRRPKAPGKRSGAVIALEERRKRTAAR